MNILLHHMNRIGLLLVLTLNLMAAQATPPPILLLHSYHQGMDWTDSITKAVQETLSGQGHELNIEYLDSKRYSLEEVSDNAETYLKQKYLQPPKFVIVADNNALQFLQTRKDSLFPDAQIFFCGINNYSPDLISGMEHRTTGVVEETDPAGTALLIRTLQPNLKRLVVISGDTPTGKAGRLAAQKALEPISNDLEMEWWTELSMHDVQEKAGKLTREDAILLITFNRDIHGAYYTNHDAGQLISEASAVPVYGLYDFYMGSGVIGGRVTSGTDQGEVAAALCLDYLKFGKLKPIVGTSPNTTKLNYPDLARYGLHHASLPMDANLINRPSKFHENTLIFIAIGVLTFLASTCAVYVIRKRHSRKKVEEIGLIQMIRGNTLAVLGVTIFSILLLLIGQEYREFKIAVREARKTLVDQKKTNIKTQVEWVLNDIEQIQNFLSAETDETPEMIQEMLKKRIRNLPGNKDENYVFVIQNRGTMLVHPANPNLEGDDVSDVTDINGVHLFRELTAAAHHPDGGYVSYEWHKPGQNQPTPKLSYARSVEKWNWIVSAGIYLDDINMALEQQTVGMKYRMIKRAGSILTIGTSAFLLLMLIFKSISSHVADEIEALQSSIAKMDSNNLDRPFQVKEFKSIAASATSAFNEIEFAQEKFAKAFQKNVAIMAISSLKDGRLIEVNEAFLNTLQFTEDEVIGKTTVELGIMSRELRDSVVKTIPETGDSGIIDATFKDRYGHLRYGDFRGQLIKLGTEPCLLSVIHDTTDSRKANDLVHQLSRAIEQSPVSVVITNTEGRIEYVNPKFCNVTGYTREEAFGQNPRVLKSGDTSNEQYDELWKTISKGGEWRGEFHNKRKDGTFFWEAATISGIRDAEGHVSHYLAVKEDVSERKKLEGQLVQAQKLESVGQLAAGIAHEINTPIQFVGDNLRFLQDSVEDLLTLANHYTEFVEKAKEAGIAEPLIDAQEQTIEHADTDYLKEELPLAIKQSLEGTERVSQIVRAMKEFSHPGSTEMSSSNLNEAIQTTIIVAKNEWKYVAKVETDFAEDLPAVPCLVSEFNQVVLNMIVNARDAIEETGDSGTITLSTAYDQNWVTVRISDTGAGMPEHVRNRIFDPFYTTKEVGKGSGQGLAIAHNVIVDKHNGELNVESTPGTGTTFEIKLPRKQETQVIAKAS